MKRALTVLLAAAAAGALACGGGGGDSVPAPAGPSDVIAFGALDASGAGALYLIQSDGTGLAKLVDGPAEVSFPLWSPRGDKIAYIVRTGLDVPASLRIYSFEGGTTTTVSDHVRADVFGPTMSWDAGGERLAFVDTTDGGRLAIYNVADAALGDLPAVPATLVAWSPASDVIALVAAAAEDTDVYRVTSEGADEAPFLQRPGVEGSPRWSPDGKYLALWNVSSSQPDVSTLLVLPRDGGDPIELARGATFGWSADSERLAYSGPSVDGSNEDIFVIPATGGDAQPVAESVTRDRWPSWSPDGNVLVYNAQADTRTAYLCVVVLEPASRDCFDLGELLPGAPAWSPR